MFKKKAVMHSDEYYQSFVDNLLSKLVSHKEPPAATRPNTAAAAAGGALTSRPSLSNLPHVGSGGSMVSPTTGDGGGGGGTMGRGRGKAHYAPLPAHLQVGTESLRLFLRMRGLCFAAVPFSLSATCLCQQGGRWARVPPLPHRPILTFEPPHTRISRIALARRRATPPPANRSSSSRGAAAAFPSPK